MYIDTSLERFAQRSQTILRMNQQSISIIHTIYSTFPDLDSPIRHSTSTLRLKAQTSLDKTVRDCTVATTGSTVLPNDKGTIVLATVDGQYLPGEAAHPITTASVAFWMRFVSATASPFERTSNNACLLYPPCDDSMFCFEPAFDLVQYHRQNPTPHRPAPSRQRQPHASIEDDPSSSSASPLSSVLPFLVFPPLQSQRTAATVVKECTWD